MASLVADLLKAAELGNIEQMVDLIEGGTAVNAETSEGWTPLIMASKEGHLEATSAVTHSRSTAQLSDPAGRNGQAVQQLLALGASPNPTRISHTALRGAAISGRTEVCAALLAAKADPNFPSQGCRTPLMGAAMHGHLETTVTLLEAATPAPHHTTRTATTSLSPAGAARPRPMSTS